MLIADFINVGYGDSILLRYKENGNNSYTILVDGGLGGDEHYQNSKNRIKSMDYLLHESVDYIDLLIITHLHGDHVGGLVPIVEKLPIKEVWLNIDIPKELYGTEINVDKPLSEQSDDMLNSINSLSKMLKTLQDRGTTICLIQEDTDVLVTDDLKLTAYHGIPQKYERQNEIIKSIFTNTENIDELLLELDGLSNSISMPIKVECHNISILLGADVDAGFWNKKRLAQSHILKLPHHGRDDSITPGLAQLISPRYVVVSVSETNLDDVPSVKAMEAFLSCDKLPEIICTDEVKIKDFNIPIAQRALRFNIYGDGSIVKESISF